MQLRSLLADWNTFVRRTTAKRQRAGLRGRAVARRSGPTGRRYRAHRDGHTRGRLVVRAHRGRAVGVRTVVVGEIRFLRRNEVAKIRLHRGDVRLFLRVRELRNRDRGQDADDDDDD